MSHEPFGIPHALCDTYPAEAGANPVIDDVTPDGRRLLMVRPRPDAHVPALTLLADCPRCFGSVSSR